MSYHLKIELKVKGKWRTCLKIKGGKQTLQGIERVALELLNHQVDQPGAPKAKNLRALIFEGRNDLLSVIQVKRTRKDDAKHWPKKQTREYYEARNPKARRGDQSTQTSHKTGGMRQSNVHSLRPGYGTHIGRGRVIHNAEGSSPKNTGTHKRFSQK